MTDGLIVGAGPGLSASLARLLARRGHAVALAALAAETGAAPSRCARGPSGSETRYGPRPLLRDERGSARC